MAAGVTRTPALRALLAQVLSAVCIWLVLLALFQLANIRVPLWGVVTLQAVGAAAIGVRLGLSRWWVPINLGFVPALALMYMLSLPAWAYAVLFVLLLLFNWNSFSERVPLYLSGEPAEQALATMIEEQGGNVSFIDLGCGLGGTLSRLARRFPQARFEGVETAPLSFAWAWLRTLGLRNCRIRYRNLWKQDLAAFDLVYCFLSPAPMAALWVKALAEMKTNARFVSNSFEIPDSPPSSTVALNDWRDSRLLVWIMPGATYDRRDEPLSAG
ncbi:class I SAM-dependent methyltransferase [Pseudomonas sp. Marseille-QA0892]